MASIFNVPLIHLFNFSLNIHCESKKLGHFYLYCNYGKCWSIFKICLLLESEGNSW